MRKTGRPMKLVTTTICRTAWKEWASVTARSSAKRSIKTWPSLPTAEICRNASTARTPAIPPGLPAPSSKPSQRSTTSASLLTDWSEQDQLPKDRKPELGIHVPLDRRPCLLLCVSADLGCELTRLVALARVCSHVTAVTGRRDAWHCAICPVRPGW